MGIGLACAVICGLPSSRSPGYLTVMPIRIAGEEDWPAIIAIYNQAVATRVAVGDLTPVSLESRRDWLNSHREPRYPLYVEAADGEVTGWCSLSAYRPGRLALQYTAEISYFVAAAHRRQGIGRRLVAHALAEARRAGIRSVFAILMEVNAPSRRLLEQLGFAQWGLLPQVAEIDGRECGHVYMGRRL